MGMKQSLLNALRKATQVSINIDSHDIILTPHVKAKTPSGASDWIPQTPRPSQKFSIESVQASLSGITGAAGGVTKTEGAEVHTWAFQLVGRYDAQVAIRDTFSKDGTIYRVVGIQPFNEYERRAVVSAIGKDPSYGN